MQIRKPCFHWWIWYRFWPGLVEPQWNFPEEFIIGKLSIQPIFIRIFWKFYQWTVFAIKCQHVISKTWTHAGLPLGQAKSLYLKLFLCNQNPLSSDSKQVLKIEVGKVCSLIRLLLLLRKRVSSLKRKRLSNKEEEIWAREEGKAKNGKHQRQSQNRNQ
jgi:hypothetical protein